MIVKPIDILEQFPVRKSKQQKQEFRDAVQSYGESIGYSVTVEKGSFGSHNVILGDPKTAKYLVTAHYDTCARFLIPNLITPCSFWMFLGYQLSVSLIILLIPILVDVVVWTITWDSNIGFLAGYAALWCVIALIVVGPANKQNVNDNTSGVVMLLELARAMPRNRRNRVCFVLFDLNEAGLMGSSSYRKAHMSETDGQIVLNLDCIGEGDHILFFPTRKLKKDKRKLNPLYTCCGQFGNKFVSIRDKGFAVFPSDQNNFPCGVGICALNKGKLGLYLSRIHTPKDTILEETNINILRAALITYITCTD